MILISTAYTWNLGDTSFRRKALIDDYKILLQQLYDFNQDYNEWNKDTQIQFYIRVAKNTTLLKEGFKESTKDKDKLARTYTNGLFKIGFCSEERVVTDIGIQYLQDKEIYLDEFEKRLNLKKDNILFLRQLLKLCIAKNNSENALNPFILLIKLLNKYDFLTRKEFSMIIQLANENTNIDKVLVNFEKVRNGCMSFDKFLDENFFINEYIKDYKFIVEDVFSEENFKEIFFNRKTSNSVSIYLEFYKNLVDYKKNNSDENLEKLIISMKNNVIKKAFGTNNWIKKNIKPDDFNNLIKDIDIFELEGSSFREALYKRFSNCKKNDLINEYVDMTIRVFNLTGIISFQNDKVQINNLYAKEYFKFIDSSLNPIIKNEQSKITEILTVNEILNLDEVFRVDKIICENYKIDDLNSISDYIKDLENTKFKKFIIDNFNKEKVIRILENISLRKDDLVFKEVTDQTTIPTIFEYILAIAWFHISDYNFNIYDSLNLTLDSSYYPLSHASGGKGDIVVDYVDHKLMLEVTLMDKNSQKRGELEPVIRHSVNLTTESNKPVYTLFVANELDSNVINIFRFCKYIKLYNSRNSDLFTNETNILSLSIKEIIQILQNDINYKKIFESMKNELKINEINKINNWKERFSSNIFN